MFVTTVAEDEQPEIEKAGALKHFKIRSKDADQLAWDGALTTLDKIDLADFDKALAPDASELGTLTEPRDFNLMFKTTIGALAGPEEGRRSSAPRRPRASSSTSRTCSTARVKLPVGIAQVGKSFRNEITPRNFTFRSREFEQMEIEFFCHPSQSQDWYKYWRDRRMKWWQDRSACGRAAHPPRPRRRRAVALLAPARPTSSTPSRSCPRASTASWRGSPTAATSTSAATWRASSTRTPARWRSSSARTASRCTAVRGATSPTATTSRTSGTRRT